MSFRIYERSFGVNVIVCYDGVERVFHTPQEKERILKLNRLSKEVQQKKDLEMAKGLNRQLNSNGFRESRDVPLDRFVPKEGIHGSNNAHRASRKIDPYDRNYRG